MFISNVLILSFFCVICYWIYFINDVVFRTNKVMCSLWDHYCVMLEDYLKIAENKPIVILLQWCKIKDFPGLHYCVI